MKVVRRVGPKPRNWVWGLLAAAGVAVSCSMSSDSADSESRPGSNLGSGYGGFTGSNNGAASGGSAAHTEPPPLPPEQEKESAFKLPVRSGRWVWAANPLSDRVSVIDTHDLSVKLALAGFGPTYLAPLHAEGDAESAAIVLNAKSGNATVMRLYADRIDSRTVPTHEGANSWSVSPSGKWAIAWSDASAITAPDPADSFQDITVVDASAATPSATRLSVGYRPSRIFFAADEARAFVVSEASLGILDLSQDAPSVIEDVALGVGREKAIDVSVVPDGSYALFRVEGSPKVSVVALASGERTDVLLSGPVTDLDLVADGTSAIAVVRGRPVTSNVGNGGATSSGEAGGAGAREAAGGVGESSAGNAGTSGGEVAGGGETDAGAGGVAGASGQGTPPASGYGASEVALLSLPAVGSANIELSRVSVPDLVGSVAVSSDGAEAVLYTNATALDRVTVLPTNPGGADFLSPRSVYVHAPVDAVFISPDHAQALVTLRAPQGMSGVGFGIVPLLEPLPAQVRSTTAPITSAAFSDAPTTSALLTAETGLTAYLVRMPELRVDAVPLLNLPLAAGIVAEEHVGYVVQQHPDGQLSLVDLDSGDLRTLTGFELSRGVSNGQ